MPDIEKATASYNLDEYYQRALSLIVSGRAREAFDIAAEGEYRALTAMYEGEDRARGFEDTAAARRYSGRQSLLSGIVAGSSTFLKEQPDLFTKYAKGKPYDFKSQGYGGRY